MFFFFFSVTVMVKKSSVWLNVFKHRVKLQRTPPYKVCRKPRSTTVTIHQTSPQVSSAKQSCMSQTILTLKRIRLLSSQNYSPSSILTNGNTPSENLLTKSLLFSEIAKQQVRIQKKNCCFFSSFQMAKVKTFSLDTIFLFFFS